MAALESEREDPLSYLRPRAWKAAGLVAAAMLVLVWRLWSLQIVRGASYTAQAGNEAIRTLTLPAARGKIVSSDGVTLAEDVPSWEATLSYTSTPPTAGEMALASRILGIPVTTIQAASQTLRTGQPFVPVVLTQGLTTEQSTLLKEDAWELPGINLEVVPARIYPGLPGDPLGAQLAANIIGFVQAGNQPDAVVGATGIEASYNARTVGLGQQIGLAGTPGQELVQVGQNSHPQGVLATKPAVAGDNVVLTINAKDQAVLQEALANQLQALHTRTFGSDGGPFPKADAAAAVVINVRTGAILADASVPTYSPQPFAAAAEAPSHSAAAKSFTQQYTAWLAEPGRPFVDHSLTDTMPPGSTFKPITAIAALETSAITPQQRIPCPATIPLGGGYVLNNWIHVFDGNLNLTQAVAFSCDTYFYQVGAKTGISAIDRVASAFGLGQPTGQTDILGEENPGTLSSPALASKLGENWTTALTMQTAIGQALSDFNVLEMADYVAALANGGTLYRPYYVSAVTSPAGKVLWQQQPSVRRHIAMPPGTDQAVIAAMEAVTQNHPSWGAQQPLVQTWGTAYYPFYGFTNETAQYLGKPILVAGKTGTAQIGGASTVPDGWFISFAPAQNPQIAVVVFTAHSNEGFVGGAPVTREFYNYYFGLDKAMWKAGQAANIIPPLVQNYFGDPSQVPPWYPATPPSAAGSGAPATTSGTQATGGSAPSRSPTSGSSAGGAAGTADASKSAPAGGPPPSSATSSPASG